MNTYCINLKHRRAKWIKTLCECKKLDIDPIRFDAIFNSDGHMGCMLSHIDLLRQINESEFMIIEDDIKVIGSINDMNKAISQLPDNWDLLYLGAELNQPITRFSDNLFILKNATVTHAIMYNNQNGVVDYIIDKHEYIIDRFYSEKVQDRFNCFITYPMICTQDPGYSDTVRWWKDYKKIEKMYNRHTI